MEIEKVILEQLDSFELAQLEKFLETLEMHSLYMSGLEKFVSGYAEAVAYDILEGEEYDEETDEDIDVIEIEIEVGEHLGSVRKCTKSCHKITRNILTDSNLTMKEKLEQLQEA